MRVLINQLFGILLLLGISCQQTIRNPEILEEDPYLTIQGVEESAKECNRLGVLYSRNSRLKEAIQQWEICTKEFPLSSTIRLNQLRFYYLLDEYEEIKVKIRKSYTPNQKTFYLNLLETLYESNRWDERVITLDALSKVPDWEIFSWEELGKYYLVLGNFGFAESYFNQILEVNPFHEEALFGMAEVLTENGKWYGVLDILKSLTKVAKKRKDYHFYGLKANFQLGFYTEALKWAKDAPDSEKSKVSFLELWRDTLLVVEENPDWKPLIPHLKAAEKSGYLVPETVFFPTLEKDGIRKRIRSGRE